MVATGIARSISPKLMFRLAILFDKADSFGDKYQRYNEFTEQQILPYVADSARFYAPDGQLAATYAAHVDRLRDLHELNSEMLVAAKSIRGELRVRPGEYERADPLDNPLKM